uniref:Hypothetical_protein n=1 Tax=Oryza brachyantha TaxID=4533 RepID=G2XM68_ORYBR|nr:hypothetical_protein [Oryza brachyantha]
MLCVAMAARPVVGTTTCLPLPARAGAAASKPSTSSSPGTGSHVGVPCERGSSVSKAAVRGARLEAAARCSLLRRPPVLLATGSSGLALADISIGDWFGNLLYSAGQQANEAVQDQLSALSFTSLAVIFGAGLVTSLSPCTLSVLPLTLGYIVVGNSVAFSLGLATTLAILGVAASFAGKAYGQVGQGLPVAASGLAVIMGLNLLEGVQAYLAGLTFALAASPCSTPVLATLLGYVATSRVCITGGFISCINILSPFLKFGAFLLGGGVYTLLDRLFPATSMVM